MIPGLKPMGLDEAALRLIARSAGGAWMALVVDGGRNDSIALAEELAEEMASIGDCSVARLLDPRDADDLASRLAAEQGPVVVAGVDPWSADDWAHFDRIRSRFERNERTAIVLGSKAFERVAERAPNFMSWLGASVVAVDVTSSVLDEDARARRLEALRAWSGRSDEDIIASAEAGTLPRDPECAEWLVLLGRGDLIER